MVSCRNQFYSDQHIGPTWGAVVSQHFHKSCNELLQVVKQSLETTRKTPSEITRLAEGELYCPSDGVAV